MPSSSIIKTKMVLVALYLVSFHESLMMTTSEPIKCPYRRWFKCKTAMDIKRDEVLISKDLLLLIKSGGNGASGSSASTSSSLQSKQFTENTVITEDIGFERGAGDRVQQPQQFKVEEIVAAAAETVSPQQPQQDKEQEQGKQGRQDLIQTEFRPRAHSPKYRNDGDIKLNILQRSEDQGAKRWNNDQDPAKRDDITSSQLEKSQRDNLEKQQQQRQQNEENKIPFFILKRIWDEARRFGNERQNR